MVNRSPVYINEKWNYQFSACILFKLYDILIGWPDPTEIGHMVLQSFNHMEVNNHQNMSARP